VKSDRWRTAGKHALDLPPGERSPAFLIDAARPREFAQKTRLRIQMVGA
jgi:hypothetical protein